MKTPARSRTLSRGSAAETRRGGQGFAFVGETYSELKKVVWPTREETTRLTILVIVLSISIGMGLGVIDYLFDQVFSRFIFGGL